MSPAAIHPVVTELAPRLHAREGVRRWTVDEGAFAEALSASVASRFDHSAPRRDVVAYLESLHLDDLALACACRAGSETAWEHFVREYRPALYAAARAIAGTEGRDLADGLYAELFGLPGGDGSRRSLLAWYHGRSKLVTWVRSVLVQRHIDRVRGRRKLRSLDDPESGVSVATLVDPAAPIPDPERAGHVRLAQAALDRAIAALDPRERLRLRLYYAEGLTLAQIGRTFGEHEATASRKLERARSALRAGVERELRGAGLEAAAIAECLEHAADAPELHLTRLLSRAEDG